MNPTRAPFSISMMVLLVDDQAIVAEAVRRSLADLPDLDFHYCQDPKQALEIALQLKPTVILQDLIMPGVDGFDLLRQYRGNPATKDIPVIVLSTKEDPKVKAQAFELGANDYLVKLPDRVELLKPKPNRIDQGMTARAALIAQMHTEPLPVRLRLILTQCRKVRAHAWRRLRHVLTQKLLPHKQPSQSGARCCDPSPG